MKVYQVLLFVPVFALGSLERIWAQDQQRAQAVSSRSDSEQYCTDCTDNEDENRRKVVIVLDYPPLIPNNAIDGYDRLQMSGSYGKGQYHQPEPVPVIHHHDVHQSMNRIPILFKGSVDYGPVNYGVPSHTSALLVGTGNGITPTGYRQYGVPVPIQLPAQEVKEASMNDGIFHSGDSGFLGHGHYKALFDLGNLDVFEDAITLSGLSSGGGLAQQLLISYPSLFSGIAVFQQTFYRCGRGNGDLTEYENLCTNLGNISIPVRSYDPALAINDINIYFRHGLIEDPANLQNKRLYLYVGLKNVVFKPEMMLNVLNVFEPFINNPFSIRTRVQNSGNLLPTSNFGMHCDQSANDNYLLGNCNLNGPFDALSFLLGQDRIKLPHDTDKADQSALVEFDQSEFFQDIAGPHFMAKVGYLYVPRNCGPVSRQKCLLHIYFHGCRAGSDITYGNHIIHSGFLELAEVNNLIMLFPQIQTDATNTLGCWDSFGSTGFFYATQKGAQVTIIRRMLSRILGSANHNVEVHARKQIH